MRSVADRPTTVPDRHHGWRAAVPGAFLLLVVAALVLLPFVNAGDVQRAHERMQLLTEPGRGAVTSIQLALALEGSVLGDLAEVRDSTLVRRYRDVVDQEQAAARRLAPIAAQLGGAVRTRFAELERMQEAWQRSVERELSAADAGGRTALHGEAYEDVLLAAARLDEAIAEETEHTQARILEADRKHRRLSAVLALLGLAGAGAVVWLARRLHVYAGAVEARGQQLRRAAEGRTRLMRGISHDLKNPLHAIDGHAQLLEDGVLGPLASAQRDSVARIRRSVRSVVALIDDLLELSRAEAGHLSIVRREVGLAPLLREVVADHAGAACTVGHRLTASIAGGTSPHVVTDAERVRQVLGNLLSNAIKYTPPGGQIVVRAERRERPGAPRGSGWVAVDVIDTGPGVPEPLRESIFEEFARLPMHEQKPGVGLGLAISRRIARLLDGDLIVGDVRSREGSGACFTLWLPMRAPTDSVTYDTNN